MYFRESSFFIDRADLRVLEEMFLFSSVFLFGQWGTGCSNILSSLAFFFFLLYSMCVLVVQWVRLIETSWTVTRQAPLFVEFSRKNATVGCHSLLQRIFPTQELNLGLPHCREILYPLSHQEITVLFHIHYLIAGQVLESLHLDGEIRTWRSWNGINTSTLQINFLATPSK